MVVRSRLSSRWLSSSWIKPWWWMKTLFTSSRWRSNREYLLADYCITNPHTHSHTRHFTYLSSYSTKHELTQLQILFFKKRIKKIKKKQGLFHKMPPVFVLTKLRRQRALNEHLMCVFSDQNEVYNQHDSAIYDCRNNHVSYWTWHWESYLLLLSHCKYQSICLCSLSREHLQICFTLFVRSLTCFGSKEVKKNKPQVHCVWFRRCFGNMYQFSFVGCGAAGQNSLFSLICASVSAQNPVWFW